MTSFSLSRDHFRMHLFAIRLTGTFLLCAAPAAAQTVRGHVLDDIAGTPVQQARVTLHDHAGHVVSAYFTGETGVFELNARGPGTHRVQVDRMGYELHVSQELQLRPSEILEVEFRLRPEGVLLSPIIVLARHDVEPGRFQFERRRDLGRGVFLDAAAIATREPVLTTDALRGVPGIIVTALPGAAPPTGSPDDEAGAQSVRWGVRTTRGWQCVVVFVDHSPEPMMSSRSGGGSMAAAGLGSVRGSISEPASAGLRGGKGAFDSFSRFGDLNDLVDPNDLRGIEVYRQWNEVPLEIRRSLRAPSLWPEDHLGPCGVVLVWTSVGW
jgi:hypothetical protein